MVLGDGPDMDGRYVVRIFLEPFVPFLWYGVLMMGLGGAVSLSDRRHRVGAPQRVKTAAAPVSA